MQLTYELIQRDFYDGFIAHRNRRPLMRWGLRLVVILVLACTAVMAVALIARPDRQALSNLTPLFLLAAFWVYMWWVCPWLAARNQFSKQPSAQGPRTLLLDDAGVHWRWDGGTADFAWKNLIRSYETRKHFLLYSSPACFNIVPKRALSADEVTQLRSLLATHIPNSARHG